MPSPSSAVPAGRPVGLALVLASVLFVLSGATGLAYEVVWFKRFSQMWGGSSASMAAVVASFLFGLGMGARLLGRVADRSPTPLKLYAVFELLIAGLAILIHYELDALAPFAASLYSSLAETPVLFAFVRFGVTFLVLGPPTILMGATLPMLVRQFAVLGSAPSHATAWLYFANSLGAAGGAWFAGFTLLPVFGIFWTTCLVAGTNVLIALVAWALVGELDRGRRPGPSREEPGETADAGPPRLPLRLVGAAGLTGLAGVALQMVWARQLAVLVGGSTYAFTAVLAVFILGIALGSLAFRIVARGPGDLPWVIGLSSLGVVVTGLVGMGVRLTLAEITGEVQLLRRDPAYNALHCLLVSFAMEGLPTFFMGMYFPALVQYARAGRDNVGATVGRLYAWNTGGSILGATTTAVVLFPLIGSYGAAFAMLVLYGLTALLLYPPTVPGTSRVGVVLGATALTTAVGLGVILWPSVEMKMRLNSGHYLYGYVAYDQFAEDAELLLLEEGATANVMALAVDARNMIGAPVETLLNIRVNGKVDGSNGEDMPTQLGTGYLPRLLRPDSSEVLIIGFGTGTTAGASLLFPDTRVDCCEIEGAIVRASKFFHEFNHAPELSPNYRTILEDGRNYIQGTDKRYDLIISEPSNPWLAGIANLYTVEFYEAVRARMNPGALLGQWIQAYSLTQKELAMIASTIREVFEHVALVRINDYDTMLFASPAPIVPDRATIDRAQALVDGNEVIGGELEKYFLTSDVRALLLSFLFLGDRGVQNVIDAAGPTEIIDDDNLRLEFDAPRYLFENLENGEYVTVIDAMLQASSPEHYAQLIAGWGWTDAQLGVLKRLRLYFQDKGRPELALAASDLGLAYASESAAPEFLADALIYRTPEDPRELMAGVRLLLASSRREAQRVAAGLGQRERFVEAELAYREILTQMPRSATVWASLAVVYDRLLQPDDVFAAVVEALVIDPLNEATQVVYLSLPQDVRERLDAEVARRRAENAARAAAGRSPVVPPLLEELGDGAPGTPGAANDDDADDDADTR